MSRQRENKDERHRQRQDEIIRAARDCFRREGFHAASMARLACAASLSVGQIYRYFPSKDAIIEEMVKRIVDARVAAMRDRVDSDQIATTLAWRESLNMEDELLMLDVAAEAGRNPRVAAMLEAADARMFSHARQKVRASHPELSDEQVNACVEVLAVLFDGTALRRLTPQKASAATLQHLYQNLISHLIKTEDK
ncbi:TetR/AcrR family transcriptional regulator [Pantoea sp. At-9b]|jgi:AcrR family transcriptional regulator|uniref:TetR/AcrR family transcriptional regulator n=1 Tax=Pantoea sp. (strain At-9b) TaxID=592316 RepID=UPI0001B3E1AF|nr:TetR/AcrR family transcriptional regulator [Pantoea sp. At-9b]ADU68947.1 transcriptional regulator, TetR family [Pantoea sp. At-9b]